MAANSERRRRGPGRPFPKGTSGNPAGRPQTKLLRQAIEGHTNNGRGLVEFLMRVLDGRPVRIGGKLYWPTIDDQMEAVTWLADRGWGKPASMTEIAMLDQVARRPKA
jgi:hypothetical protein